MSSGDYAGTIVKSTNPSQLAKAFSTDREGRPRFTRAGGGYLEWIGEKWVFKTPAEVQTDLAGWLLEARVDKGEDKGFVPIMFGQQLRRDVMEGVEGVAGGVRRVPRWEDPELNREWDPRFCVGFRDQVLDVRTLKSRPRGREWVDLMTLPVDWEKASDAECPLFEEKLKEWTCGDEEMARALQELYGYLLITWREPARAPLLVGKPRGGKTMQVHILGMLMGRPAMMRSDVYTMVGDFGKVGLELCRAWVTQEITGFDGNAGRRYGSLVKQVLGRDVVAVNQKYHDIRETITDACPVLVSNKLLDLPDHAESISSKLLVFPFSKSWLGHEDMQLEEKLRGELAGIARWAVEGVSRLLANGGRFTESKRMQEARAEQARAMNLVQWFLEDRMVQKEGFFMTTTDVEWHFRAFLKEHELEHQWTTRSLAKGLVENTRWAVHRKQCTSGPLRGKYGYEGFGPKREYLRGE